MIVSVASGKGGTGKTSILASFAHLGKNKILADCDVDAADLHLLLGVKVKRSSEFKGGKLAVIDREKCTRCEECEKACQFEAIRNFTVDPLSCEGCSLCSHICPEGAIEMREKVTGWIYISKTRYGPLVHAKLGIGEGNSGKLVTRVRNTAEEIANKKGAGLILIDGSPGIGCSVIASITGVDLALIVTEPTLSATGVKVATGASGTVREAIENHKQGKLQSTSGPSVGAHFGMGGGMGPGGAGMRPGMGMGFPQAPYGPGQMGPQSQISREQELSLLKRQTQAIEKQLEGIKKRIEDLEKG